MKLVIAGTGSCVPETKLRNEELERLVDTSDDWIQTRTGIVERGRAGPEIASSDLALVAARHALEMAELSADQIELIIVCTVSPDTLTPATSSLVHRELRVSRPIPCFDMNAACSGFIYGLEVSGSLMRAGGYTRVLLIGAESLTKFTDYEDRDTCVLFGDAAGAVVLELREGEGGLRATVLKSDGNFANLISIPGGGSRRPPSPYVLAQRQAFIQMNGRQVFKIAVQAMEQVARDVLERAGWQLDEVDHVLVHQANRRIIEAVAERLELPSEKVPTNIEHTGNTSAASIPVLMDECNRAGRFSPGDKILCAGFGAGLTWGGAAIEWTG